MNKPPKAIAMRWCPECGRDDRFTPFTGKSHFMRGERCPGQPIVVKYALYDNAWK